MIILVQLSSCWKTKYFQLQGLQWGVVLSLAAIWHKGADSAVIQSVHRAATDTALCGIEIGWESCAWLWNALWLWEHLGHGARASGTNHWLPQWSADNAPVESLLWTAGQLCFTECGLSVVGCKVVQKVENKNLWKQWLFTMGVR